MSERIRQLAEQARKHFPKTETSGEFWVFDEQKFAQLIVKECIKKCKDHPSIIFKNEWDADVVAPDIVSRLESHFGVEE